MTLESSDPHVTWNPVEVTLSAEEYQLDPYTDVEVTATFEHESGRIDEIPGFWDGNRTWKVRFAPPKPGHWSYEITSAEALDGLAEVGDFEASTYVGDNPIKEHGFLTVADDDRSFAHSDGTPFFWLADTAWPAGAKATPSEWERYLDRRAAQGFNVVQVNTLPQWDASRPRGRSPFGDEWDLDDLNPEYFRALDELVEMTHERGIVPALVVVWRNYVADDEDPTFPKTFSDEQASRYARYLGARYGAFGATWFVSGDSGLGEEALEVYDAAATALRESVTYPLLTLHMVSSVTTSEEANRKEWFDYHLYQSGHHYGQQQRNAYRYAVDSRDQPPARPVVNGEPCYERHGYFEEPEIRIPREAVRRAAWWSVLSGANAGITYGAHGIWHWHRQGEHVSHAEDRGMPEPWEEAISYPGAWDYAVLKSFMGRFSFGSLEPRQDVLVGAPETVRAAQLSDDSSLLVYTPDSRSLVIDVSALPFDVDSFRWFDPRTGQCSAAETTGSTEVSVDAVPWEGDAVLWCDTT